MSEFQKKKKIGIGVELFLEGAMYSQKGHKMHYSYQNVLEKESLGIKNINYCCSPAMNMV